MKMRRVGKHTMFKEAKSVRRAQAAAGSQSGGGATGGPALENGEVFDEDDEEEQPAINLWSCIILLLIDAALVGVTAEWLVDSINGLVAGGHITEQWVGLILLPIGKQDRVHIKKPRIILNVHEYPFAVGNAAEHVTAVTVSYKDKLDLSSKSFLCLCPTRRYV